MQLKFIKENTTRREVRTWITATTQPEVLYYYKEMMNAGVVKKTRTPSTPSLHYPSRCQLQTNGESEPQTDQQRLPPAAKDLGPRGKSCPRQNYNSQKAGGGSCRTSASATAPGSRSTLTNQKWTWRVTLRVTLRGGAGGAPIGRKTTRKEKN